MEWFFLPTFPLKALQFPSKCKSCINRTWYQRQIQFANSSTRQTEPTSVIFSSPNQFPRLNDYIPRLTSACFSGLKRTRSMDNGSSWANVIERTFVCLALAVYLLPMWWEWRCLESMNWKRFVRGICCAAYYFRATATSEVLAVAKKKQRDYADFGS